MLRTTAGTTLRVLFDVASVCAARRGLRCKPWHLTLTPTSSSGVA